jgi:hypothetical protein
MAQFVAHLGVVVGDGEADPFAAYQIRMQRGLFDR